MSILIEGMEMPKSCPCELLGIGYDLYCSFAGGIPARVKEYYECCQNDTRPSWCPLVPVPTHGRLADLDKIENEIAQLSPEGYTTGGIRLILDHAPTIIPADGNLQNNSGNANNSEVIANIPAEDGER